MERKGDWIETFTGRKYYPLDPRPEDVDIRDIAHALALKCRFGGHCRCFYSVAQHSVYVGGQVGRKDALWGLLHDAAEAYLADICTPVKVMAEMSEFRAMEKRNQAVICQALGLAEKEPDSVRGEDKIMLLTEARSLLPSQGDSWGKWKGGFAPHDWEVDPWAAEKAERIFLRLYDLWGEASYAGV